MIRKSVVGLTLFLLTVPLLADKKLDDRMMHAASILQEIRGSLDEEAPGVLNNAYAVAIFPEFVKVGLLGAVKHGRGVLATRQDNGDWSKPAFVRLTSGSLGLQFGVSTSQLLIVFKDPKAVDAISGGQFTIGADAGYAAGDLGGAAGAGTDNKFQNQIVAMARSKGLFAGVALEGGVLRIEKDANVEFYNSAIGLDGRRLLEDTEAETPAVAQHFQIVVKESVPPLPEDEESLPEDEESMSAGSSDAGASAFDSSEQSAGTAGPSTSSTGDGSLPQANPVNANAGGSTTTANTLSGDGLASASASPAPMREGVSEGTWVTPGNQESTSDGRSTRTRSSGDSRLAGELASRARGALWDGAVDLARNQLRDNSEVRKAELAAKAGSTLAKAAIPSGSPSVAGPSGSGAAPAASAARDSGQWIEVPQAQRRAVADLPKPVGEAVMSAPGALAGAPRSSSATSFTGPPSPSEWPEEWLQQQTVNGACVQGS